MFSADENNLKGYATGFIIDSDIMR